MTRESFLEAVKLHYSHEIHSAFTQCEHGGQRLVDIHALNERLERLSMNAMKDGLSEGDFIELVQSTLPYVWDQLDLSQSQEMPSFKKVA